MDATDDTAQAEGRAALPTMTAAIGRGDFLYLHAGHPTPGAACWGWLYQGIRLIYALIKQGRVRDLHILATYTDTPPAID